MLKIISWNINSVRSRIEHLTKLLEDQQPDIVLLQEIKCVNENFPIETIEDLGYNVAIHGQKSYNGVAIFSKFPIDEFTIKLTDDPDSEQARYIEALISANGKVFRVASVYVPNGQEIGSIKFDYKLKFFDALYNHINNLLSWGEIMIIGGDFNVAPEDIDVYDSTSLEGTLGFHQLERSKFRSLINLGLIDAFRAINLNKSKFSWWDYRAGAFEKNKGMRIDQFLLSPEAADLLVDSEIDIDIRKLKKSSDHAPISCILDV